MIAILTFLLWLPLGWTQQPKPGGTLRVAWDADISGLDPPISPLACRRGWWWGISSTVWSPLISS